MRRVFGILSLLVVFMVGSVDGQQGTNQIGRKKAVVVPTTKALIAVASQPDAPLEFEDAKYIAYLTGGIVPIYHVRNRSSKPIRSFTVGDLGGTWSWTQQKNGGPMMPGSSLPDWNVDEELIPLTEELIDSLKLGGPMTSVGVLMVIRVEFVNGSVYMGKQTFDALEELFDGRGAKAGS